MLSIERSARTGSGPARGVGPSVTAVEPDELWQAAQARRRCGWSTTCATDSCAAAWHRVARRRIWSGSTTHSIPTALTICFARRMATYKRAALLLSQPDRLRALLSDDDRPVQFVFAGKAHPADDQRQGADPAAGGVLPRPELRDRFVFVEDYDMALARALVQGADVWLNTPVRPLEASGTSGMKAVLNGALHCSVLDGWWAECFGPATEDGADGRPNGWAISSAESVEDEARRSRSRPTASSSCSRHQIVPLFHDRGAAPARAVRSAGSPRGRGIAAHPRSRSWERTAWCATTSRTLYLPAAARAGT